jgi:hypothetical protein
MGCVYALGAVNFPHWESAAGYLRRNIRSEGHGPWSRSPKNGRAATVAPEKRQQETHAPQQLLLLFDQFVGDN